MGGIGEELRDMLKRCSSDGRQGWKNVLRKMSNVPFDACGVSFAKNMQMTWWRIRSMVFVIKF